MIKMPKYNVYKYVNKDGNFSLEEFRKSNNLTYAKARRIIEQLIKLGTIIVVEYGNSKRHEQL